MVGPARDAIQLLHGLMGHMRQFVGDGASYAMLHYAAVEEGKRIGAQARGEALPEILQGLDGILLHRTEIVQDDGRLVRLRVHGVASSPDGHRPMQGVVLGLVEGALTASRASRYKGRASVEGSELLLELRREP